MAKDKKGAAPKRGDEKSEKGSASPKSKDGKADKGENGAAGKRKLGLRGAAPWAARHAAKHAAEARARAAEPPLPGSARATIRVPAQAEDIKQRIGALHNAVVQIKGLRKNLHKTFFDIGGVLKEIQTRKLYEAKGYGSFEAFLEREIDLGKTTALRLVKVFGTFQKEAALELGMERLFLALNALEFGLDMPGSDAKIPAAPVSATALPLKPPGR